MPAASQAVHLEVVTSETTNGHVPEGIAPFSPQEKEEEDA